MLRKSIFRPLLALLIFCSLLGSSCKNSATHKLERQMEPLAKQYLAEEQVKDYTDLKITCVDTITEVGYAQLTVELLNNMEAASEEQYANQEGDHSPEVQYLMLQDIYQTKEALEEALTSGGLSSKGVLLYMVTGTYLTPNKEQKEVVFLVNADKKSLHTLDPFGDNLVLQ